MQRVLVTFEPSMCSVHLYDLCICHVSTQLEKGKKGKINFPFRI